MASSSTHAPLESPTTEPRAVSRWGLDRRLEFIDFRLRWDRRLNRSDVMAYFGISVPQASLDIARYSELAPGNLVYDRSAKVYVATQGFQPLFPSSSPSRYLNELLAAETGVLAAESSFLGWRPPVAFVPVPGRALSADMLATLLRAVRERTGVRVLYQSMSRPEPHARMLSPHAFAHDGFRWHVRAFCHSRQQFRDFVIARMLEVELAEGAGPLPDADEEWQTMVEVELMPNPNLAPAHRRAVELEYGMVNGEASISCRHALLFYVLRHLGLDDPRPDHPESQQVVLRNREVIERYRQRAVPA